MIIKRIPGRAADLNGRGRVGGCIVTKELRMPADENIQADCQWNWQLRIIRIELIARNRDLTAYDRRQHAAASLSGMRRGPAGKLNSILYIATNRYRGSGQKRI